MNFIVRLLLTAAAVLITSYVLPGVEVASFPYAILVAAVLGLLNTIVKPVLIVLTIPITFITLGLFLLFINAFIILIADYLLKDFKVDNIWWALLFSLILSIINSIIKPKKEKTSRGPRDKSKDIDDNHFDSYEEVK
jgi:putative membrane protein